MKNSIDYDNDGKVDRIINHRNNQAESIIYYEYNENGERTKVSSDKNLDGKIDFISYDKESADGKTFIRKRDNNADGVIDEVWKFTYDDNGKLTKREIDNDNDGKFDEKDKFDKNGEIIKQSKLQSLPSMILNFFKNLFS